MISEEVLLDYNLTFFQDNNSFKYNLDSVLLAEYVELKKNKKILDMCSGNAIVPLILLTKEKSLSIDCVEIQKNVCKIAQKNININKFDKEINIINDNLKNVKNRNCYDIVTCNPPYLKNNNKKGQNKSINISKHEIYTNIEEIIKYSKKYLNPKGTLYIIFPTNRITELLYLLQEYTFGVLKITYIITNNDSIDLMLVKAQKSKKSNTVIDYINVVNVKSYKNIFNNK